VVAELAELGCGEVVLIGGEAYLRNDFILIIRAIREAGMSCTMTTGGLNLERGAGRGDDRGRGLGVTVSIDGLEATHDAIRGVPGSWGSAFAALRRVRAGRQDRLQHADQPAHPRRAAAAARAHRRRGHPFVAAADHRPARQRRRPPRAHPPAVHDFLELFAELEPVIDRCEALGVRLWPANNLGYFGPLERRLRKALRTHWRGCSAGVTTLGLDSDGGVKNCPSLGGPPQRRRQLARAQPARGLGGELPARVHPQAAPSTTCGATVASATTPTTCMAGCTAPASRCSGARATTRFATTAR
jgi:hypothetical protein